MLRLYIQSCDNCYYHKRNRVASAVLRAIALRIRLDAATQGRQRSRWDEMDEEAFDVDAELRQHEASLQQMVAGDGVAWLPADRVPAIPERTAQVLIDGDPMCQSLVTVAATPGGDRAYLDVVTGRLVSRSVVAWRAPPPAPFAFASPVDLARVRAGDLIGRRTPDGAVTLRVDATEVDDRFGGVTLRCSAPDGQTSVLQPAEAAQCRDLATYDARFVLSKGAAGFAGVLGHPVELLQVGPAVSDARYAASHDIVQALIAEASARDVGVEDIWREFVRGSQDMLLAMALLSPGVRVGTESGDLLDPETCRRTLLQATAEAVGAALAQPYELAPGDTVDDLPEFHATIGNLRRAALRALRELREDG